MIAIDEVDGRDEAYKGLQPEWGNVAVDNRDRVHIVWIGSPDMQRYHQWSEDGGETWTPRHVAIPSQGYNNWFGMAFDGDDTLHVVCPSLEGVEYSSWTGSRWPLPLLFEGTEGAHHAQAVLALGNQLHAVWQDHGGDVRGLPRGQIVHAMMHTGAPSEEPRPLPTARPPVQPTATAAVEETAEPTSVPTARPTYTAFEPPTSSADLRALLLLSLVPSFVLIGIVFLFRSRRT
jgi:hypothetical protein